ncbi:hypothetical protein S245_015877, partial [Arachis hypogaea]
IGDWNEQFRNRDDELPKYMHNGGRESGPPSSSGPGHLSFKEATGIRLPLGVGYYERKVIMDHLKRIKLILPGSMPEWLMGTDCKFVGNMSTLHKNFYAVRPFPGIVVQLVRAPPCQGGSCGFEPRQSRMNKNPKKDTNLY